MATFIEKQNVFAAWQYGGDEPKPEWVELVEVPSVGRPLVRLGDDFWSEINEGDWVIYETECDFDVMSDKTMSALYDRVDLEPCVKPRHLAKG